MGLHIVVEVKTSDVGAMTTAALVHDIDYLVSDTRIPSRDETLGLYVVSCPDPEMRQLAHRIMAEGESDLLRAASVQSLLSLAEVMAEYDVSHEEVLAAIVSPSLGRDPIVDAANLRRILRGRDLE